MAQPSEIEQTSRKLSEIAKNTAQAAKSSSEQMVPADYGAIVERSNQLNQDLQDISLTMMQFAQFSMDCGMRTAGELMGDAVRRQNDLVQRIFEQWEGDRERMSALLSRLSQSMMGPQQ